MTFIRGNQDIILREYSELYIRLQSVKPKASDRHIVVAGRWEGTSPDVDMTARFVIDMIKVGV
jgi:hypothetical protein